ncbi:MAG: YceI family protein [Capnocytophaga sp.]|jgi:YCE I like family protein|nr:YceI family protein [uncultured Capnocytophaga sp.]RKW17262.1 MAG: YceI family protein [Capnocytophaga sp.]
MKKIVLSCAVILALTVASCKNNNANAEQAVEQAADQAAAAVEQAATAVMVSGTYTVEPSSVVEWVGKKPTGQHTGTIGLQSGSLTVDNGKVTGDFTIDMNSITVTDITEADGKLDLEAHLKGTGKEDGADHFFNVKTYPTGTFKLTSFDGANVTGDLTLKGKTKTISFPATLTITDNEVTLESKPFEINRVDFGVNYASKSVFGDLKDKFINDEIELVVKVKAKK